MSGATVELVRRGMHALRRSGFWWGVGVLTMAIVSVAFWPSLEGSAALTDLTESSKELMEAFGAQDLSTAAGYLDGQMYALMLPLLLSGLAIAVLVAGYIASYLLPLADALEDFRRASPWYWAIGTQPISDGIAGWWIVPLLGVTAALIGFGTVAVNRRDIRGA